MIYLNRPPCLAQWSRENCYPFASKAYVLPWAVASILGKLSESERNWFSVQWLPKPTYLKLTSDYNGGEGDKVLDRRRDGGLREVAWCIGLVSN